LAPEDGPGAGVADLVEDRFALFKRASERLECFVMASAA
jgi:hypothetical protein